jgi:hypothetical protein
VVVVVEVTVVTVRLVEVVDVWLVVVVRNVAVVVLVVPGVQEHVVEISSWGRPDAASMEL